MDQIYFTIIIPYAQEIQNAHRARRTDGDRTRSNQRDRKRENDASHLSCRKKTQIRLLCEMISKGSHRLYPYREYIRNQDSRGYCEANS